MWFSVTRGAGFFSVGGDMFFFRRDIFELNIYIQVRCNVDGINVKCFKRQKTSEVNCVMGSKKTVTFFSDVFSLLVLFCEVTGSLLLSV